MNPIILAHNCFILHNIIQGQPAASPNMTRELDLQHVLLIHISDSYILFYDHKYSSMVYVLYAPSEESSAQKEYLDLVDYLVDHLSNHDNFLAIYQLHDEPAEEQDTPHAITWRNSYDEECELSFYGGDSGTEFVKCNNRTTDICMYAAGTPVFRLYTEHNQNRFVLLNISSINSYNYDPLVGQITLSTHEFYKLTIRDVFTSRDTRVKMDLLHYLFTHCV